MTSPALSPRPAALDTRSLGRPVHLLPRVAVRLRETLHRQLCLPWNRRYHAHYDLREVTLQPLDRAAREAEALLDPDAGRWLHAMGPSGLVACRIDRMLVNGLMARRLGLAGGTADPAPGDLSTTPITATEERLLQALARQGCQLTLQGLAQLAQQGPDSDDGTAASELPALQVGSLPTNSTDAWEITLVVRDADAQPERDMSLRVVLDGAYLSPLLRQLASLHRGPSRAAVAVQPLARRLTLKLQARLLEQEMELGSVLDLAPGSLIPIHLADATVLVEGSALMRAAVAEHHGKLCLTSFEDLE
jgi:flagellar motor switch protein FliM